MISLFLIGLTFLSKLTYNSEKQTNNLLVGDSELKPETNNKFPILNLAEHVEANNKLLASNKIVKNKINKNKSVIPSEINQKVIENELYTERKEHKESRNYNEFLKSEFELLKDPSTGKIPKNAHHLALEAALRTNEFQLPSEDNGRTLPSFTIEKRGPFNFGGRTRSIGHDVRDNNIIIAGGNSGGILRSTDAGLTWTSVTPANDILSVNAIAQDPRAGNQDIWYCGTGEINSSASGSGASYYGFGIWKSTNNGLSWTALSSTRSGTFEQFDNEFDFVTKIFVDPTSGDVYAGVADALYKSTDQGNTWNKVLGESLGQLHTDIIKSGNNYFAAINGKGIWKSTTGNINEWTQVADGTQLGGGFGRIVLGSSASNDNLVYALYNTTTNFNCSNSKNISIRLQRLDVSANTWTDFSNAISLCNTSINNDTEKNLNPQDGYNLAIAVKPDDANLVYFGGDQIYRLNTSNNEYVFIGGDQGSPNGSNMHVDCHFLKFADNNILWSCNDGGIHRTDVSSSNSGFPQGFNWSRRTGNYNCYQFYRADISPVSGSKTVGGGAQDNANNIITDGTTNTTELGGGDGVQFAIISGSTSSDFNLITSTQEGSIFRREGNGNFYNIQPSGKKTAFKTFFLLDADNTNYLYYMADNSKIYRTRIAASLTSDAITGDPTTGYDEMNLTLSGINVATAVRNSAFSNNPYAAADANRLMYIGTSSGKVYRLSDPAFCTSCSPVEITPPGSSGSVSDIAINPQNNNEIMVTYSNYGVVGVYHTSNANNSTPTWTDVEGNGVVQLASVRSSIILISGSTKVYIVGTSVGLYGTTALSGSSTNWQKIGGGINEVGHAVVVSMRLRTADNGFVLGTHGSGLLYLTAPPPNPLPIQMLSFNGHKDKIANILNWSAIESNPYGHYSIERSSDAINFKTIGEVNVQLNNNSQHNYTFVDRFPLNNSNYYKLSIIENDGKITESKIIEIDNSNHYEVMIYPNPNNGIFTISDNSINFEIYDSYGKKVNHTFYNNTIDISDKPNGNYYLKIQGESVPKKIVKTGAK